MKFHDGWTVHGYPVVGMWRKGWVVSRYGIRVRYDCNKRSWAGHSEGLRAAVDKLVELLGFANATVHDLDLWGVFIMLDSVSAVRRVDATWRALESADDFGEAVWIFDSVRDAENYAAGLGLKSSI